MKIQGEHLYKLLKENGSMQEVDVVLTRESIQENSDTVEGEWYTEQALKNLENWDEYQPQNNLIIKFISCHMVIYMLYTYTCIYIYTYYCVFSRI